MKYQWLFAAAALWASTTAYAYDYYVPFGDGGQPVASYYATPNLEFQQGSSFFYGGQAFIKTYAGDTVLFDDSLFSFGDGGSLARFQTDHTNASVRATAHAEGYPNGALSAVALIYALKITAPNSMVADQIEAIMRTSPLATATGDYTSDATRYASASVSVGSGINFSDTARNSFLSVCYDGHRQACQSGSYTIDLGFWRGTRFVDGDANTFYGQITISVDARAATDRYDPVSSDSLAFVDPTITFAAPLRQFGNQVTYDLGNGGLGNGGFLGGAVPEPASWAMLIGGFGFVGATARKHRAKAGFVRRHA